MRVALIGALECNIQHFRSTAFDKVIAVDYGWEICQQHGISADLAVGDFDSLGYVPSGVEVVRYPAIKDESDMELALRVAVSAGATEVYLYGAFAGRLDHTLANIGVLTSFTQRGVGVFGIGSDFAVVCLAAGENCAKRTPAQLSFSPFNPAVLQGCYGPYISVFPCAGSAYSVHISGLQYEVDNFTLIPGTSRGLSNEFTGTNASISVGKGIVICIFSLDALAYVQVLQ